jgi:hypothetical protein
VPQPFANLPAPAPVPCSVIARQMKAARPFDGVTEAAGRLTSVASPPSHCPRPSTYTFASAKIGQSTSGGSTITAPLGVILQGLAGLPRTTTQAGTSSAIAIRSLGVSRFQTGHQAFFQCRAPDSNSPPDRPNSPVPFLVSRANNSGRPAFDPLGSRLEQLNGRLFKLPTASKALLWACFR